jgi:hypothetical protein
MLPSRARGGRAGAPRMEEDVRERSRGWNGASPASRPVPNRASGGLGLAAAALAALRPPAAARPAPAWYFVPRFCPVFLI